MLSELPTELLFWICGSLQKEHILKLCLVCHRLNSVFTEALFRCLMSDKLPPLLRTVTAQRLDIAALLIEKYHVNIDSEYAGKNALLLAIELRYPQAVDLILRYKPDVRYSCDFGGRGPLSLAVIGGNPALVERILQSQEIDVNDQCSDGLSAILYALKRREYYILHLLLVDSRANVNIADHLGWTPLQSAVLEGDHIAVQMLVQHAGTDIHLRSSHNDAPLLLAAKKLNRQQSVLVVESLLLHSDLGVNISDSKGRTALWHAVNLGHYDLVKLLLRQNQLRLNDPDRYGVTPLARAAENPLLQVLELLLEQPQICINSQTRQIVPPLWSACRAGNFPAAKALLRLRSVQVNQKSPTGTTPLQVAVNLNHLSIVSLLLRQRNMVDINARGHQQWTAIFFAASNGYVWVTKSLLRHPNIDLKLIDDQGRTPLWWAEHGGHSRVVALLRTHCRLKRQKRC
jgi:ankyrin repeat protein